ncbi:MAG: DUF1080 domain-containing protein [Saprospiraceae bacterium]|nr:DUF1080 domain-containing protein [Saprospiraceae bacterium]
MKVNVIFFYALLILSVFQCTPTEQNTSSITELSHNTLTEAEKNEGWQLLFDGSSLDQWKGYNKLSVGNSWQIDAGVLQLKVDGGSMDGNDIITKEQFRNFIFQTDFKLSKGTNSGIFYFVKEVADEPIWFNAPEYQLIDDEGYVASSGQELTKKHLTGDNYDLQSAAEGKKLNPVGEWNTAKIVVNNGRVEHYLNGEKTVEYDVNSEEWANLVAASKFSTYATYGKTNPGHIGLQDHGQEIAFRNIKIKKL